MEEGDRLFFNVLHQLQKVGILQHLILIGGWCQKLYRIYFNYPIELSPLRTADIDFLVPIPTRIKKEVNLPVILSKLGFDEVFSTLGGYSKYVHPDLEIEFVVAERGRGKDKPYPVKELKISAQRLRYLNILQRYTMTIEIKNIKLVIPEPDAFIINKFIISTRRKNKDKKEKDLITAIELGEYILKNNKYKAKIKTLYDELKPRIKKNIIQILKSKSEILYNHFI